MGVSLHGGHRPAVKMLVDVLDLGAAHVVTDAATRPRAGFQDPRGTRFINGGECRLHFGLASAQLS